jgi:hypothetical protein
MENRIEIRVTISHYVYGQGRQYTSDIEPLKIDKEIFGNENALRDAINDYCLEWASYTAYDTDSEDYVLEFWHGEQKIKNVSLSDYSDLFGRNL